MTDFENGVPPEDEPRGAEETDDIRQEQEPPKTFAERHEELIRRANGGRSSLLIIFCAALLNMLLLAASNTTMSFSMSLPQLAIIWARQITELTGVPALGGIVIILAALVLLSMFVLWRLSRRHTPPITAFLVIYALDTLLLIIFTVRDIPFYILDYLFHAWGLFAVIDLLRNRMKLNKLWREEEGADGDWPPDSHK